jgi:N-acetylmuramoyl-L-alanine amidase
LSNSSVEEKVALYSRATVTAPLRVLAGANMPAVLIELGFLSNGRRCRLHGRQ